MQENYEENGYEPIISVWEHLAETDKPIVMYGMGDGAEKILSVFDKYGIKPAEFMASDEFVRGHYFKGYKVKKLSEIEEQYDDFIVVICFGTQFPDVIDRIETIAEKYEVVAPDVPVIGGGLFDGDYISDHECDIMQLRPLLADDTSRIVFDRLMKYRITGRISELRACETPKAEAFELLNIGLNETYVDLGAYNGDTIEEFLKLTDKRFEKIYAMEPDKRNYSKMRRRHYALGSGIFEHYNTAAWNEDTTLTFYSKSGRNSALTDNRSEETKGRAVQIEAKSVDSMLGGKKATIIKYDVEGSEEQAILGSVETIRQYKPRLIVSLYHRTEDMIKLPLLIHEINPEYKLYLRHHPYIPAWDTNLYCI